MIKSKNLKILKKFNLEIPDFEILNREDFEMYREKKVLSVTTQKKILSICEKMDFPVIVRSDCSLEDRGETSSAGLFCSVYPVKNIEECKKAVIKVYESFFQNNVWKFFPESIQQSSWMGIMIQKFIEAPWYGVCFSMEPCNMDRTIGIGEIAPNCPDSITGGTQEKLSFSFFNEKRKILARQISPLIPKISDEIIYRLMDLIQKIKEIFNYEIDMEFALTQGKILILQVRKIVDCQEVPEVWKGLFGDSIFSNLNLRETMPDPLHPLSLDFILNEIIGRVRKHYFKGKQKEISGEYRLFVPVFNRLYWDFTPLLSGKLLSSWLKKMIWYLDSADYEIFKDVFVKKNKVLFNWSNWKTIFQVGIKKVEDCIPYLKQPEKIDKIFLDSEIQFYRLKRELNPLNSSEELQNFYLKKLVPEMEKFALNLSVGMDASGIILFLAGIQIFLKKGFYSLIRSTQFYLKFKESKTSEGNALFALIQSQWKLDNLQEILEKTPPEKERLRNLLISFFNRFGHRGPGELDLYQKRFCENSEWIANLLSNHSGKRNDSPAKEEFPCNGKWVYYLKNIGHYRESAKYYILLYFFLSRVVFLELGKLWFQKGLLSFPEEIFFLTIQEIMSLKIAEKDLWMFHREKIHWRRLKHTRYSRKEIWSALSYRKGKLQFPVSQKQGNIQFQGTGVSQGIVKGRIRKIHSMNSISRINPEEIILVKTGDPALTLFYSLCKGIIMEVGGILSHCSIVAREMGLPMITGIPGIYETLEEGTWIEINGSDGTIRRIL